MNVLNYNNENDIYDGQQRILTIILILNVLGSLSEKLKNKINQLLTVDTDIDSLTVEQNRIKQEYDVNIIPKMCCVNPYDMKGLVNIFNGKIKSCISFLKNVDEIDDNIDELDKYVTPSGTTINRKSDFIRHLEANDLYEMPDTSTKLHNAFIEIYNYIVIKNYHESNLIKLYKFILNDIDIQYYNCTDPKYVSRIFDWENNRGKAVESLDIIKNPILVKIPDNKKVEVYEKWENLKHKENNIYKKNFGQKIFDIAIQIYNKNIQRVINLELLFQPIIDSEDTYKEILVYFKIVEKLFKIMDEISNDKFGRLINNTPRICLNWEAYMWCLLPIFYITDKIDNNLIHLMSRWFFRNIQFRTRSFNNLCYSNEFIRLTNEVFKDKDFDYYKEIEVCFRKNKGEIINDDNYAKSLHNMNFKSTNATHLLMFYETTINTDQHIVPLDYTLEHIYAQKHKTTLNDISLMDNIGNLTLYEGKNSQNGHKGNSSLGSKSYDKKKISYAKSNSIMTRNIAITYSNFEEKNIIERNKELAIKLNEYTNY